MEIGLIIGSFVIGIINLLFFQKLFFNKKIIDNINHRSSHNVLATRTGGVALFTSTIIISLFFYLNGNEIYDFSIMVPLSILLLVGCYDDIYEVDFKLKFIFQIIAAKILIDSGFIIENLHGVFGINELSRISSQLLTMFIIVAIINAINFIDGIDGLALAVITFFIVLFEVLANNSTPFVNLSIILTTIFIPMFYFNFRNNKKVFLGDSGSLFLGGLVSIYVMHILSNEYIISVEYDVNKIFYVFSVLTYPIVDLSRIVIVRISKGFSPFKADKNHIHHILLRRYNSHIKVVLILLIISFLNLVIIQTVL